MFSGFLFQSRIQVLPQHIPYVIAAKYVGATFRLFTAGSMRKWLIVRLALTTRTNPAMPVRQQVLLFSTYEGQAQHLQE